MFDQEWLAKLTRKQLTTTEIKDEPYQKNKKERIITTSETLVHTTMTNDDSLMRKAHVRTKAL